MAKGLLVTLSNEFPTILNLGEETIEIIWNGKWNGKPSVFIKANENVGITGAHLLEKARRENIELKFRIEQLEKELNNVR
jgi:hypothetical protein